MAHIGEPLKHTSLEKYLRDNIKNGIIEFQLRASEGKNGIEFYIHPDGKDGDTLDFWVEGNLLISIQAYDNLMKLISLQ